jgi:hypothetical protein
LNPVGNSPASVLSGPGLFYPGWNQFPKTGVRDSCVIVSLSKKLM